MPYMSVLPGEGTALRLHVGAHSVMVDRAPDSGGHGAAPSALELFVGSVAACAAEAAGAYLVETGCAGLLEVGCHYELSGGHVTCVQLTVHLDRPISAEDRAGLLRATHRCGLSSTLAVPVQIAIASVAPVFA